jgi:catalase-peroxidase
VEADDPAEATTVPDAHDPSKRTRPMMFTTDMALRMDPIYEKISRRFHENPDSSPTPSRAPGSSSRTATWGRARATSAPRPEAADLAGPDSGGRPPADRRADIAALKAKILASGLSISQLVSTAWASASTFRGSDKRGGANGARIRLAPQKDWEVNQPAQLARCSRRSRAIQQEFNARRPAARRSRSPT